MSLTASVVSAAILEGNLIIGLSDGSVINCGYVQGPPGLKGDAGPMGADGDAGRDGNTILTVAGTPRNDMGTDGDYAIDNINWRIYGPKSGGVWGKANEMLPSKDNLIANGRGFEGVGGGGGDPGGGGGGIVQVLGGDGIEITPTSTSSSITVSTQIDTFKGLQFDDEVIQVKLGSGLEFDTETGAINNTSSSLQYRGIVDVTSDSSIPAAPNNGDTYANTVKGTISSGWSAIIQSAPASAQIGDLLVYSATNTKWTLIPTGGAESGEGVYLPLSGGELSGPLFCTEIDSGSSETPLALKGAAWYYGPVNDDKAITTRKYVSDNYATQTALQDEADTRDTGDKVNLGLIEANKSDIESIEANYAKKSDVATATAALPYTIETDKALRLADIEVKNRFTGEVAPMYAGGEIYLTDNLSFFSNVRFTGTNNITTSSDAQGIIVDGANLMPKNLLSLPELT